MDVLRVDYLPINQAVWGNNFADFKTYSYYWLYKMIFIKKKIKKIKQF